MEANQQYNVRTAEHYQHNHTIGRVLGGLIVLIAGMLLLVREMGVAIPSWIFTWQMLLIAIGIYVGVRQAFRGWGWFILVTLGLFFFMDDFISDWRLKDYFWPALIMLIGLIMIFKTRRRYHYNYKDAEAGSATKAGTYDDYLDIVTVLGGVKKNIVSRDFKGGEIVTIFGGTELNLTGSDLTKPRTLELTQIFGGTKLVVPSGWIIQTDEVVAILGGVGDKRTIHSQPADTADKILRLKGTCIFGGIDIVSY